MNALNKFKAEFQLADNGEDAKSAKVKIVARKGTPIDHPFWGVLVHDFSGMKVASKIPLDYAHDYLDSIGYLNKFDTSSGDLVCSGAIVPFSTDKGAEVIAKVGEGVPYEASIEWGMDYTAEYLALGETAEVNGNTVNGPATIIREWTLVAVAVCKFGADPDTSTELELSQTPKHKRMFIKVGETKMSLSKEEVKPVEAPAVEPEKKIEPAALNKDVEAEEIKSVEAPAVEVKPEPTELASKAEAVETIDPRAEARKFIECFGEVAGAKYFALGLSFSDAMTSHLKMQAEQIAALETRLKSSDRGAAEPVKFTDESKKGSFGDIIKINGKSRK